MSPERSGSQAIDGSQPHPRGCRFWRKVRLIVARLATAALAVLVLSAVPALASQPSYPLLVDAHGLRVYGPSTRSHVCPRLLALPSHALRTARRAVTLAMPPFEARLKLNGRDPVVSVVRAIDSGYSAVAGGCGRAAWRRSIVAFVRLPHVRSASLSQRTFAVARMRSGWVLWAVIH